MSWLLIANNFTSAVMIIACWWLAHQYARVKPPGRGIAACFALLGLTTLVTLFARNVGIPVDWPVVASKAILSAGFVMIIIRRHEMGDD